ncbi:MAG: CoB--CoM heterodisulfide reductase iron-sulfur subunit B family protein [Burkholderiales bacterium]|nr:CoB--CoM heterodisulfide reductase iron-sulfur subunit B family protein [Burkholderiales bacterium]
MKRRYAYFPGCSAKGTCRELDTSTNAVAALFDVELQELENPGCTGAREFRAISEQLHLTANARILALAERVASALVVVCDTCLLNLIEVNQRLREDAAARERVNRALKEEGLQYHGKVEVKHFLWVLTEDLGEAALRARIVRPLRGLRVAPFYGCHIQRPASVLQEHSVRDVPALDWLCTVLGAEVVDYPGATRCCGFHVVRTDEKIALRLSGSHLGQAKGNGAQCVVTPCPLCHTVLDAYQPKMASTHAASGDLPILHVSQLAGLAMGLDADALGIPRHVVACEDVLTHVAGARLASSDRP